MTLDFILHCVVVLHAYAVAMIRPFHTLIDMSYCRAETKATPASVNRSIRVLILHNVVKRLSNRTARLCSFFGSTDGYGV